MSQSENLNPLVPLVRAIVQEVISELLEDPLDRGPAPRLLSVEGAAKYRSRTPSAIRNMITTKKLKPVRLDGRVYLDVQKLDRMPHISPMSVRSETRKCFVFIGWVVGFEPTATGTTITRVCTTHVQ